MSTQTFSITKDYQALKIFMRRNDPTLELPSPISSSRLDIVTFTEAIMFILHTQVQIEDIDRF